MDQTLSNCRKNILSEDYLDVQLEQSAYLNLIKSTYPTACIQTINEQFHIAYINKNEDLTKSQVLNSYSAIPKLYGLMQTSALESAGIIKTRTQPLLNLTGRGVLIGFVDTGIDYRHPAFLDSNGKTRIAAIWDQTIQNGEPPEGFLYGTEYTEQEINWALTDPSIIPSTDENGHGTYLAGVAAGSSIESASFLGAASDALIAMVKLKPAKSTLKEYYRIKEDTLAYQENDIMTGVHYLVTLQQRLNLPLVICLGLGTNMGGHMGCCFLESYLNLLSNAYRTCVVCAAGNEAGLFHHYRGQIQNVGDYKEVEILVGEEEQQNGFVTELWSDIPQIYAVGFVSPTGDVIDPSSVATGYSISIRFVLDNSIIELSNYLISNNGGSQVIRMRFLTPNSGIWKIRIFNRYQVGGIFDLWLPIRPFISTDTIFLEPDNEVTITVPANGSSIITVAAYNHETNSIYINSGRGNSRTNTIKPTLAAPGVRILGPLANTISFSYSTGTSSATAITAGAIACIFSWAVTKERMPFITGTFIHFFLIVGVRTNPELSYPNKEWGYGTLDLYHTFEELRRFL